MINKKKIYKKQAYLRKIYKYKKVMIFCTRIRGKVWFASTLMDIVHIERLTGVQILKRPKI